VGDLMEQISLACLRWLVWGNGERCSGSR